MKLKEKEIKILSQIESVGDVILRLVHKMTKVLAALAVATISQLENQGMGIGGILPVTYHLHGITDSYLQITLPRALPTLLNPQIFDNKIKISICEDINIASHLKQIR